MPVVESLKLVSFGRPRNVSWHPYAKRHLGCVRASIFPSPARLFFVGKNHWILFLAHFRIQATSTSSQLATEGYAATQLLGGQLADALGSKWVLAAGLSCWSLATAITPLAAANGAAPLLAARLALGLGEGGWVGLDGLNSGKMTEKSCRKVPSLWENIGGIPIVRIGLYLFLDLFWAHKSIRRSH